MRLVWPAAEHLPGHADALARGWSPDTVRPEAAQEEPAAIGRDPQVFLAKQVDREAAGGPVRLPDGSAVPRLPGWRQWMWDGQGFCGAIGFRWQRRDGRVTEDLPPHVLGHIGYSVVPWRRREGHATAALAQLLPLAHAEGLRWVWITTDPGNLASQRVIEANGGVLHEHFTKPPAFGGGPGLRYRIDLTGDRA
ncbi:MAG: GNAT family N-acetyltransferase [Rubrivivax sp.]